MFWLRSHRAELVRRLLSMAVALAAVVAAAAVGWAEDTPDPATAVPAPPPPPPEVEIKTSMGTIRLELDPLKAPTTVANFLRYAADGYYDGTIFHRVVAGYLVQAGGFQKQGDQLIEKPTGPPIKNEADNGLRNVEGAIAMARTDVPDSATAAFFINCRDNEVLDQSHAAAGYAVFGRVTSGMEVVRQINEVRTGVRDVTRQLGAGKTQQMALKRVPLSDIVIESVRLLNPPPAPPPPPESATPPVAPDTSK